MAELVADKAMGVELRAIEVEQQLEWAEAQGRADDARRLQHQLRAVLDELADVVDGVRAA